MAKYRQLHTSFWQDGFVLDLTPEEKYFYLYIMTNPKTSQCGIYELPKRIIETETGYNRETVQKLLQRFVDYKKIDYHEGTKELMIHNWIKYNPPNNTNAMKCIVKELNEVKNLDFSMLYIKLVIENGYGLEGLSRGLQGAYNTLLSNKVINNKEEIKSNNEEVTSKEEVVTAEETSATKSDKKHYAEYVIMTEEEYSKLVTQYGEAFIKEKIIDLNLWKGSKGKKTKSDYLTILTWIRRDSKDNKGGQNGSNARNNQQAPSKFAGFKPKQPDTSDITEADYEGLI